jgi:formamidopyrimidine-DNA glycosylase
MPEGPEVRTLVDQLYSLLVQSSTSYSNKIIKDIQLYTTANKKVHRVDEFKEFIQNSKYVIFHKVDCVGKFIYFLTKNEKHEKWVIFNTLEMTGNWQYEELSQDPQVEHKPPQYRRISLRIEDSSTNNEAMLHFCDKRSFGNLSFGTMQDLQNKIRHLGIDMLNNAEQVDFYTFKERVHKNKNKNICKFLMDQKNCAGVGNYIKSESLFLAQISPKRDILDLSDQELYNLFYNLKDVMYGTFQNKKLYK